MPSGWPEIHCDIPEMIHHEKTGLLVEERFVEGLVRSLYWLIEKSEMLTNPIVSIIIPTYNRAGLLHYAIRSVLGQTFQDFELIIVDDGSYDNTEQVVKGIHDPKIRYLRHETNRGGSAARNTGIMHARGKYIGLLDDDDEWYSGKLQKQMDIFKVLSDDYGLVYTGFAFVSMESREILHNISPTLKGYLFIDLLKSNILGSPTPLIKKSCFEKAGYFDEKLPSVQDWDMWIRISKYYKYDFVPNVLARHYVHKDQISANLHNKIEGREILMDKFQMDLLKYPSIYANHLKQLGILCCLAENRIKGRNYLLRSLRIRPLQKGVYLNLIFSFLGKGQHRNLIERHYLPPVGEVNLYK